MYISGNIFIFGQALMRFFIYDADLKHFILYPMNDAVATNLQGAGYNILGQAWSLSIEMSFYLLVPFLLIKNTRLIFKLCIASFALRLILAKTGYTNYNIQHAFFPVALGVFILGVLSHRIIYQAICFKSEIYFQRTALILLTTLLLYGVCFYQRTGFYNIKYWAFIFLVAFSLPFIFGYFKNSKIDRFIGELSYPIYMTHFICISLALKFVNSSYTPYYVVLSATGLSILLVFLVIKPLDRFRYEKFTSKKVENLIADEETVNRLIFQNKT
jgi:peptidoglycan/LPS O-acetylase OafA/YrhL